jgi:hypothetical protein
MAKGNRVKGVGGWYDKGQPGHLENERRKSQSIVDSGGQHRKLGTKQCTSCKVVKPIKGGKHGSQRKFICAECCGVMLCQS